MLDTHRDQRSPTLLPPEDADAMAASDTLQPKVGMSPLTRLNELRNCLAARGLGVLPARWTLRCAGAFGILMYHRICEQPRGAVAPTWNVRPRRFRAQLESLLARGFQAWALRKALAWHQAGQPIPPKVFVVTFDDVYANVYRNAFPVLQELAIPATLFLATGYLDSDKPFPFDGWSCRNSSRASTDAWKPVTSAQCDEMLSGGLVELGTHTHTHADFRGRPDELRRDLAISQDLLRTRFGIREPSFAFPFGFGCRKHDGAELSEAAEEAGVCCALTTNDELVQPGDDPFNWGRFAALETDTAASLAAKLDGRYSLARQAWRWLRRQTQVVQQNGNGATSRPAPKPNESIECPR